MRSTDERVEEVLGRARAHEAVARRRRQRAVALGGGLLSVVAVVLVGVGVASVAGPSGTEGLAGRLGLMGSVLADGSALGYVVVGLLGIVLGAAVTVLSFRLGHPASRASREEAPHGEERNP